MDPDLPTLTDLARKIVNAYARRVSGFIAHDDLAGVALLCAKAARA